MIGTLKSPGGAVQERLVPSTLDSLNQNFEAWNLGSLFFESYPKELDETSPAFRRAAGYKVVQIQMFFSHIDLISSDTAFFKKHFLPSLPIIPGTNVFLHGVPMIPDIGFVLPAMQETLLRFLGQEDLLKKGPATHSNILGLPLWLRCIILLLFKKR